MTQIWETFLGGAKHKSRGRSTGIDTWSGWNGGLDLASSEQCGWKGELPVPSSDLLHALPCGTDLFAVFSFPECKLFQKGRIVLVIPVFPGLVKSPAHSRCY